LTVEVEIQKQARVQVDLYPYKAGLPARLFLSEERPDFEAECNLCGGSITYRELAEGVAVVNSVGEMWHKRCEDD